MKQLEIKGTYTAIITPFNINYSVDFDALKNIVEHQIQSGINGIVVLGSTGEAMTLNENEKIEVMLKVQEYANARVPIIVGTGSNNTQATIEATIRAEKYNFDGVLLVCPYYNKPNAEGLFQHYKAISEAADIPQILYNVPSRSGVNINAETQLRIAENCKNVVAAKEASGDMEQMMQIIKHAPAGFSLMSGDDSLAVPCVVIGGKGVISVLSNYAPKMLSTCTKMALDGKYSDAMELHYKLLDFMKINFTEPNPIPVKAIMSELGMIKNVLRLPLIPISNNSLQTIQKLLKSAFIN